MKRIVWVAMVAMLGCAVSAQASTYFGFQIGVSNAPPPPRFAYHRHPHVYIVPDTRVYYVDQPDFDYDVFEYGPYWYACRDGYWYRSPGYDGPFRVVDVRYVPRPILGVPREHWRHREWERPAVNAYGPSWRAHDERPTVIEHGPSWRAHERPAAAWQDAHDDHARHGGEGDRDWGHGHDKPGKLDKPDKGHGHGKDHDKGHGHD